MRILKYYDNFLNEDVSNGSDFIEITTPIGSSDFELFREVVNRGIDSHLEAFTKSKFEKVGNKYRFNFHKSEKHILLRRLQEMADAAENEEIDQWISDIENYDELTKD